jgi:hypothetical protein
MSTILPPSKVSRFVLLFFGFSTLFLLSCKKDLTRSISVIQIKINYPQTLQIGATQEVIGNYTAFTGTSVGTTYTVVRNQPPNNLVAIRVSFKVVPINGAPSSLIVKTFLANLVHI